jgi:hypothetical protein
VRRRLFNLAAAVSLVPCVALTGLWMPSRSRANWISYSARAEPNSCQARHMLLLDVGSLAYEHYVAPPASWQCFPPGFARGPYRGASSELHDIADVYGRGHP